MQDDASRDSINRNDRQTSAAVTTFMLGIVKMRKLLSSQFLYVSHALIGEATTVVCHATRTACNRFDTVVRQNYKTGVYLKPTLRSQECSHIEVRMTCVYKIKHC